MRVRRYIRRQVPVVFLLVSSLLLGGATPHAEAEARSSVTAPSNVMLEDLQQSFQLSPPKEEHEIQIEVVPSRYDEAQTKARQEAEERAAATKAIRPTPGRNNYGTVRSTPVPKQVPKTDIEALIIQWANHYGVSADRLLRVAKCESGYNPTVVNRNYTARDGGNPTGLFQFLPSTFRRYQAKAGLSGLDIFNASDSARVAAFAFSVGGAGEWECK